MGRVCVCVCVIDSMKVVNRRGQKRVIVKCQSLRVCVWQRLIRAKSVWPFPWSFNQVALKSAARPGRVTRALRLVPSCRQYHSEEKATAHWIISLRSGEETVNSFTMLVLQVVLSSSNGWKRDRSTNRFTRSLSARCNLWWTKAKIWPTASVC